MIPTADGEEEEEEEAAAAAAPIVWNEGWRGPQRSDLQAPAYKYPLAVQPDVVTGKIDPIPLGGTR